MCESCNLSTDLYNICHRNTIHLYQMKNTDDTKNKSAVKSHNSEIEKAKPGVISEMIEYMPNSVVTKPIFKKLTGNLSVISFDAGEGLSGKISRFDTFVQVIEGKATVVINKVSNLLQAGQAIIIPAHTLASIRPNGRFKMISTVIKSGYE